jgi:hypothetical protein
MKAPPCIQTRHGREPSPAPSLYTRTGTGPCGPGAVSGRTLTSGAWWPGWDSNSARTCAYCGSSMSAWIEGTPSRSGKRELIAE